MSEPTEDSDQDFDPSAEMLVNDFDDEHTLEEEEAMESADNVSNELDDLQREGEMPLDQVLAMYGYESGVEYEDTVQEVPEQESDSSVIDSPEPTMDNQSSSHSIMTQSINSPESDSSPSEERKIDEVIDLVFRDTTPIPMSSSRPLLRTVRQASESSDTGTDYDYSPDEDWRKTIQVGSDYQAVIPEGLSKYDDAPAYENEDRLLWDPSPLTDQEVEDYLRESRQPKGATGVSAVPTGSHVRDDEQALFLLLQCGHNREEALRRKRMQPLPPADETFRHGLLMDVEETGAAEKIDESSKGPAERVSERRQKEILHSIVEDIINRSLLLLDEGTISPEKVNQDSSGAAKKADKASEGAAETLDEPSEGETFRHRPLMYVEETGADEKIVEPSEGAAEKLDEPSEEEIFRRRLLMDGEGTGAAEKINELYTSFMHWFIAIDQSPNEIDAGYKELENKLDFVELRALHSFEAQKRNEEEIKKLKEEEAEIESEIVKIKGVIAEAKQKLKEVKPVLLKRQKCHALATLIAKLPDRKQSQKKLQLVEAKIKALASQNEAVKNRMVKRGKYFSALMTSAVELKNKLRRELEEWEDSESD